MSTDKIAVDLDLLIVITALRLMLKGGQLKYTKKILRLSPGEACVFVCEGGRGASCVHLKPFVVSFVSFAVARTCIDKDLL